MKSAHVYLLGIDAVFLLLAGFFYILWDGERLDNGTVPAQQFMFVLLVASSLGLVFRLAHYRLPTTAALLVARGLLVAFGSLLYTGNLTACFMLFGMAGVISLLWRARVSEDGLQFLLYILFFFIAMSLFVGGLKEGEVQVQINNLFGIMLFVLPIVDPFILWLRSLAPKED